MCYDRQKKKCREERVFNLEQDKKKFTEVAFELYLKDKYKFDK